jgi:hypothetical protein
VLPRPVGPGAEVYLLQPAYVIVIGHFSRRSDGCDTPAGLVDVQAIDLERDDGLSGSGGELTVTVRFNDDVTIVKREMDELDRWQRLPGIDDSAHGHGCHEPEAFIPGQLLRSRAVGVHSNEDAGS